MYPFNITGALTAQAIFFLSILIFAARIARRERLAYWLGIPQMLTGVVLIYLIFQAARLEQPGLYYIETGVMLFWLMLKLVLVYLLHIEFQRAGWAVIYMLLFLAGTAGMVGVAGQAGMFWLVQAAAFYVIMVALAFFQLARTRSRQPW